MSRRHRGDSLVPVEFAGSMGGCSFVGRVLIDSLLQPPVIDDESKVEKEAGSPPQEKAPQDPCEIQVNYSQRPDLDHSYLSNCTIMTITPDHTHSLGLPFSTMAAGCSRLEQFDDAHSLAFEG
ncbi:hypothetical protein NA56DRAFT_696168 [Hyaloscypha hepaticicola]|uniref:Uncharacterized protein n=1 Tax=Hyaloscypha hepaticicola TaxID=2082293 RepID=A0A2J6QQ61_9HELO|nr:hypothetical protein NA56DRAFT_696168 [Hyaloscypha hepaticicola]